MTRMRGAVFGMMVLAGGACVGLACVDDEPETRRGGGDEQTEEAAAALDGAAAAVSVGDGRTSCAIRDGFVYCWGQNLGTVGHPNAFGIMAVDPAAVPAACKDASGAPRAFCTKAVAIQKWDPATGLWAPFGGATSVAVGTHHACAVTADGKLHCWGDSTNMGFGSVPAGDPYITGTPRMCKTSKPNTDAGQITTIIGCKTPREIPLPDDTRAISVVAHNENTCAILQDTTPGGQTYAYCAGAMSGLSYHLGFDPTGAAPPETDGLCSRDSQGKITRCWALAGVRRLSGAGVVRLRADEMSIDSDHACAIAAGTGWCWGYSGNDGSALGFGDPSSPPPGCTNHPMFGAGTFVCWYAQPVSDLVGATHIVASAGTDACNGGPGGQQEVSCATTSGATYCWGSDRHGTLGNGECIQEPEEEPVGCRTWVPDPVANRSGVFVTGGDGTMCLGNDAGVYCWAEGWNGTRGDGLDLAYCSSTNTLQPGSPVLAIGGGQLTGTVALSGRSNTNCAWTSTGLWCWGYNGVYGSLGAGDALPSGCNSSGSNSHCTKAVEVVFDE